MLAILSALHQEKGAPLTSWTQLVLALRLSSPSGYGTRPSLRRGKEAAAELAECKGLQPSSDQAGRVHGLLSFPFCKMRILPSPGCLGDTAKRAKPHCCKWEDGRRQGPSRTAAWCSLGCCSPPSSGGPAPNGACEAERMGEPVTAHPPGRRAAMNAFPKACLHWFLKVFQARRARQRAGTSAIWKTTHSELSLMWGTGWHFPGGGSSVPHLTSASIPD